MPKSSRKKKQERRKTLFILLIPVLVIGFYLISHHAKEEIQKKYNPDIPQKYLAYYLEAEKKYGVPWYVLAAHHRVETRFSTMKPMVSPAGAEGPMQFMPCSFVGWKHPSCSGLGKGNISENDKTNPAVIHKYGGYGVDADGDGKADPFDDKDAIFSAANYLARNGAASGRIEKAVYSYNHSNEYVTEVMHYARMYKKENVQKGDR
ncbi:lytic transglycosylase domain-containing protein [Heyndrickxia acidiproducens]|uniref:lytic transglycosylase domain-containing protein n=1 Tax=Heyndrickxia acidiproducens TaxID=1121084 RepID=UPI0004758D30|nr:lytic transglycosylase domain-containing protein [Heyndrickxia acidiproducens]